MHIIMNYFGDVPHIKAGKLLSFPLIHACKCDSVNEIIGYQVISNC